MVEALLVRGQRVAESLMRTDRLPSLDRAVEGRLLRTVGVGMVERKERVRKMAMYIMVVMNMARKIQK